MQCTLITSNDTNEIQKFICDSDGLFTNNEGLNFEMIVDVYHTPLLRLLFHRCCCRDSLLVSSVITNK